MVHTHTHTPTLWEQQPLQHTYTSFPVTDCLGWGEEWEKRRKKKGLGGKTQHEPFFSLTRVSAIAPSQPPCCRVCLRSAGKQHDEMHGMSGGLDRLFRPFAKLTLINHQPELKKIKMLFLWLMNPSERLNFYSQVETQWLLKHSRALEMCPMNRRIIHQGLCQGYKLSSEIKYEWNPKCVCVRIRLGNLDTTNWQWKGFTKDTWLFGCYPLYTTVQFKSEKRHVRRFFIMFQ